MSSTCSTITERYFCALIDNTPKPLSLLISSLHHSFHLPLSFSRFCFYAHSLNRWVWIVMENSVNMFGKSESPRSPTRLQKQAPTALHLGLVPENPFLQQSSDVVGTTAIPLLSPLFVSPSPHSSLSKEGDDSMLPVGLTEKNGSQWTRRKGRNIQPRPTIATRWLSWICFRPSSCL